MDDWIREELIRECGYVVCPLVVSGYALCDGICKLCDIYIEFCDDVDNGRYPT